MTYVTHDQGTAESASQSDNPALPQPPQAERCEVATFMEAMPYSVYVIGSARNGRPNGMIADWVMQVSLDPHLIAISIENDSYSLESIRANGALTVNLLPRNVPGIRLAARFVQPHRGGKVLGRGRDRTARTFEKLHGIAFATSEAGCPIFSDALAWIECETRELVPVGDHTLVIARAVEGAVTRRGEPLTSTFTGWATRADMAFQQPPPSPFKRAQWTETCA